MKYLIALWLALTAPLVWASCTTHSYTYNGQYVTCTTCCFGGSCNTNCY